ncbi:response regulator [Deltaproteobacteria bacterium TL4]
MNILFIDDEAEICDAYSRHLHKHGYTVQTANNGEEGWQIFSAASDTFDVIVTDIKMPVLGGLEMIQRIRDGSYEVPIIVMTGHGDLDVAIQALKYGAFEFVTKPFKFNQLTAILAKLKLMRIPLQKQKDSMNFYEEKVEITIPSQTSLIDMVIFRLQNQYQPIFQLFNINHFQISVCLSESLMNAIVHGNLEISSELKEESMEAFFDLVHEREAMPEFANKVVKILGFLNKNECRLEIIDQGKGFNYENLPDPTDPSSFFSSTGRGLFLIRQYMEKVSWQGRGNHLIMSKLFNQ